MLQRSYLKRTKQFTRAQHQAGPNLSSSPVTDLGPHADMSNFNQRYYHVLHNLVVGSYAGRTIDRSLTNEMVDYGKSLWPELSPQFEALRR